jgi:ubiquinone/menaquinone biosynthesis C-methylase UbiE
MAIKPEIERYYTEFKNEPGRLERHPLEKFRTQQIISRYLPPPPAAILDVGGAAGVYTFWLSGLGYQVHLIDPVEYHLAEARSQARACAHPPLVIANGDARRLDYPDHTFDIVLLLGPLYHLEEYSDRIAALKEAKRVAKKNGIVISAYISRFSALVDGYFKDLVSQPAWCTIVESDTATGRHYNPTGEAGYFTSAYFHHPGEIGPEIEAAGLVAEKVIAIESFAAYVPDLSIKVRNAEYQQALLKAISAVEEEKSLLGMSGHILGIGRKPK